MKPGVRALGVAESARGEESTLAGAVVRTDRVVDGFAFSRIAVGGLDATGEVCALVDRLDREDVPYILLSGVAPAWFNLYDLHEIHARTGMMVCSVSFEGSDGLEAGLREAFSGEEYERRLTIYERQPPRNELWVNDDRVFVRSVGLDDEGAAALVRAFTPEGGRPEPIRVARLAARAVDEWREE
ncbi:endonuclease dU [Natronorarus salvus]|uniref:endonuclease dU n=1 Tax=Natronorarus salvus TaxID=3117733 RepID=UPI002F268052